MNLKDRAEMHRGMDVLLDRIDDEEFKCCINCEYFTEATELCGLVTPGARPPVRVMCFGCPSFKGHEDMYQLARTEQLVQNASAAKKPSFEDMDDDIPF